MGGFLVASLTVGELAVNCYFLVNQETGEALIFDPGDEVEKLQDFARKNGWSIKAILLTHGHSDHMGGVNELREQTGAKVYAMEEEKPLLSNAMKNLSIFIQKKPIMVEADEYLRDGQELELCGIGLKVLLTPGHTPGGCCYYCREAGAVFSGDTLFCGSVGRSDFPGGSMSELVRSVKEKLFLLPEDTKVYPGHGDETTIEYEKKYNLFVQ